MALKDIKGEATFDMLAELIDPIMSIASDPEAAELFKRGDCPEGEDPREFVLGKIRRCMPKLVKAHKRELCAVMAACKGVDAGEYAEGLTPLSLMGDLLELMNDEEFRAFLS